MESQRAADAKAARDTSLVAANRERRQEQLRAAQELVDCLGAGMDLLSSEQVKCRRQLKLITSVKVGHSRTSDLFYIRFGDYTVIVTTTINLLQSIKSLQVCLSSALPAR